MSGPEASHHTTLSRILKGDRVNEMNESDDMNDGGRATSQQRVNGGGGGGWVGGGKGQGTASRISGKATAKGPNQRTSGTEAEPEPEPERADMSTNKDTAEGGGVGRNVLRH